MGRFVIAENALFVFADLILLAAAIYGICAFFFKKAALYFRILTLATLCYASCALFKALYYLCYSEDIKGLGITFLCYFGCFLSLFCANYGQYNTLIDDGSRRFRKYRISAVAAPVFTLGLLLYYILSNVENTTVFNNVINFIGYFPAVLASYYNLKHFLVPDMDFTFIRWIRRINLCALLIECLSILHAFLSANGYRLLSAFSALAVAICFLLMLLFAERGRKTWFQ